MIRALFRRLMASNEEYQARHQLQQDGRRLRAIRHELAGLGQLHIELRAAEIEAMLDVQESARQLRAITNPATADNEEMREA